MKKPNFKIGDKVLIERLPENPTNVWWYESMDELVGQSGIIVDINEEDVVGMGKVLYFAKLTFRVIGYQH